MVDTLTKDDLSKMIESNEDFLLVNVLPKESFDEGHIPKSINIPLEDEGFEEGFMGIANKDDKIVVYCASFECNASDKAAKKLEGLGFKKVYDYEGGMKDWKDSGYEIENMK